MVTPITSYLAYLAASTMTTHKPHNVNQPLDRYVYTNDYVCQQLMALHHNNVASYHRSHYPLAYAPYATNTTEEGSSQWLNHLVNTNSLASDFSENYQ